MESMPGLPSCLLVDTHSLEYEKKGRAGGNGKAEFDPEED
jgi:hypothetical protein